MDGRSIKGGDLYRLYQQLHAQIDSGDGRRRMAGGIVADGGDQVLEEEDIFKEICRWITLYYK